MYNIHNALFCCPTFRDAILHNTPIQHECSKEPVYVVEEQVSA